MGIPKKALRHSQLTYQAGSTVDGSHQTSRVTFEEDGVFKKAFFKELEPKNHYPELLAKISVATSSFKRLFQGKRSAEERLVFDDEDKIIGTLSICLDDFKSFHFASEGIPADTFLKEQVAPSSKTLIEKNVMEILFGRWYLDDDDAHPHNLGLNGDFDFDMFCYWFTLYMKEPRMVIGIPKTQVSLTVRDYEMFPNVQDSKPYHWAPFPHPGKVTLPVLVPVVQEQVLPKVLPKAYADPIQFARLAQDSVAQEQKFAAALKALLTFQPELQRKRLTELFGDLPLNYTSLDETDVSVRAKYEELFPAFCNEKTNVRSFVDFMMGPSQDQMGLAHEHKGLYQEHYDNLYRVVVFYMGCSNNGFGVPLPATCLALYQKPSFYRNIEAWVIKENATTYANDKELQYSLPDLQKRYHQVWRDAFAPTFKELLHSSYRLTNALLKEATSPPHFQLSELVSKAATDNSVTSAWELFGTMPELSSDIIESKIAVEKDSKIRDALLSIVAFTNQFHALAKTYYTKKREELTEEDNLEFSNKLSLLYQQFNLKIRQDLANTSTYASEFNRIATSLKLIAEQVNFKLHLTTTDEFMEEAVLSVKKEVLPFIHEDVKRQYFDSLFLWAKSQRPEDLERYINEIIDKKYTPTISSLSYRQRSEPVKKYLRTSTQESGDNRLAYIFTSGSSEDGALNRLLIEGLTPLMLQKYPIPSIDIAIRDKSFEAGLVEFTKHVVYFAKKDKRFTHLYSDGGRALFYKTIYDWVDSLSEKSFNSGPKGLIRLALKKYESGSWGQFFGISTSRKAEVSGYLKGNTHAKALALIFMKGEKNSALSECLFDYIIEGIQKEIKTGKKCDALTEQQYKLVEQFDFAIHKEFYLEHLQNHEATKAAASHRQLMITSTVSSFF